MVKQAKVPGRPGKRASRSTETTGWRDIKSAPKDGTEVLLYRPLAQKTGDKCVAVFRTTPRDNGCWPATVPAGCNGENYSEGYCYATHWMPLPDAPHQKATRSSGERGMAATAPKSSPSGGPR